MVEFRKITVTDLVLLAHHLGPERSFLGGMLWDIAHSTAAGADLVWFVNFIILPILANETATNEDPT